METITTHKVTMHNDNDHGFAYVTACLMKYCEHNPIQAEQCALITHNKGKCDIKYGEWIDMYELSEKLLSLGLMTTIEEN